MKISEEKQNEIINLYKSGISCTKIGKFLHVDRGTVSNILNRHGIIIVNRQNLSKFNEHIFDSIDTEEKAYWLGFIFADGYISSRCKSGKQEYKFELSLKESDIEHLHKFNKFMEHVKNNVSVGIVNCNGTIFTRCRWIVANKHLWETLNSYGCTPKKSLTLKFPNENIFKSSDLIRHFIRGYFDGDGCISYYKFVSKYKTGYSAIIKILGTKDFLIKLATITNLKYIIIPNHHSNYTFSLEYSQIPTRTILKWLYNDSIIYLNRKYKRALFFMDKCRSEKEFSELLASEIGETPIMDNPEVISKITKGLETP